MPPNQDTQKKKFRNNYGNEIYPCEKCEKTFGRRHDRKRHMDEVHEKLKSFDCCLCQKTFSRLSNIYRHFHSVHRDVFDEPNDTVQVDVEVVDLDDEASVAADDADVINLDDEASVAADDADVINLDDEASVAADDAALDDLDDEASVAIDLDLDDEVPPPFSPPTRRTVSRGAAHASRHPLI